MARAKLIAKRPTAGISRSWEFPRFTRTRLDSGVQVIVAPTRGHPLGAQLLMEAGPSNEPQGEDGSAGIAAGVLHEGTENYKGPAFVQAVEGLGANISAFSNWDSFTVNLQTPAARMEPALELLGEVVRRPAFDWRQIDRVKRGRVGGILQEYTNATTRARIAFDKMVYTQDSAYSRSDHGSYWSVIQVGKRKVKKYYEEFATPGSATLILAGDLEGVPAIKIAEKVFGDWKRKEPERPKMIVRDGIQRTAVLIVHRPDSKQSRIEIGHVGAARSTPDYFPLTAMSIALGGLANSRMNRRLREDKGYTYGASAGFTFRREAGPFRANTSVDTPVTVDAVAETIEILRETHSDGITNEELEEAKGFLIGSFPVRFETPAAVASGLASLITYGLPDDYYETYRAKVEKVTLDEANQAAAEHLRPDKLAIVVVGDAEKIREPMLSAGFGTVAVIEDPEPGEPPIY